MKVLITGTGKGLGGALALYYLENGNEVYGISRSKNNRLEKYPDFHFISQDLSEFDEVKRVVPGFLKQAGKLDLVILNAGIISEIKDMEDCSLDEIKNVMDINVWSNKVLIDILFSNLESIRQIAAISSGASVNGNRGWNAYSLSKAALNMLVKLYAAERENTHFCSIAPGIIDTGMQDYIYSLGDDPRFSSLDKLKKAKSSGQMPTPDRAAARLGKALVKALNKESGSFLDVREMEP